MLKHENRIDDYMSSCVDTFSAYTKVPYQRLSSKTLTSSPRFEKIIQSLEGLAPDERVKYFCKTADQYTNALADSIKNHVDAFKKQIALIKETIPPLLKVNMIFRGLYGDDKMNEIINTTQINYFPNAHISVKGQKDGSMQLFIIEKLCLDVAEDLSVIRQDLMRYLDCKSAADNQLEYPDFAGIANVDQTPKTLEQLGYTADYALQGIDTIANSGEHIKLSANLLTFMGKVDTLKKDILNRIASIKKMSSTWVDDLKVVETSVIELQTYSVLFGSIIVVLQAVAYAAYESAYKVHLAEIDFNKSQTR